ncbi:hypothetical protein EYF80_037922 [Liparis tanakae]|uniref:Uncharacterized protein n=1 Tax=Liparis tanakae TaxID=230148 RepID=A0A4Z2GE98_9TELE|nr:hypothetical protein EYF80_037922 [Liparis tanakae]
MPQLVRLCRVDVSSRSRTYAPEIRHNGNSDDNLFGVYSRPRHHRVSGSKAEPSPYRRCPCPFGGPCI